MSDGFLFSLLDRLPEPWGMVVAWLLYFAFVAGGFALALWLLEVLDA